MGHCVVHVVGTMGAGKTTLLRVWKGEAGPWEPVTAEGRVHPLGYVNHRPRGEPGGPGQGLFLAGAYVDGLQTSGCDTIKDTGHAYDLVQGRYVAGLTVIYEGLFMMNHTRGLALLRVVGAGRFYVLRLTTSLDECRAGVLARRAAQGNSDPLPPRFDDGLRGNEVRATNYSHKMRMAGATVHKVSRDGALGVLRELTS